MVGKLPGAEINRMKAINPAVDKRVLRVSSPSRKLVRPISSDLKRNFLANGGSLPS